ncbi:MAG TPA: HEPN domain-containing protein [Anaerolineales bacterium]|nr:HEPN domain-containing protein [Anaerolineales bacterium]
MRKYAIEIKSNLEHTVISLQAAKELLEKGQYDNAASRAADAAFHTASALLLDEEIETNRHGDVITLIHQIFVNGRRLTKEQGEKLSWLFQLGTAENPDPSGHLILGEAQKAVEFAESFFEATKVILDS